ncbi:MAG: hypothetical protein RBQ97_09140 [Acholeplasma sp.]|nr:hypothetical protein [Acholeplasma sp.]
MNSTLELIYFIIVTIGMIYAFYRLGINKISILVILIFWAGLFQYIGVQAHNSYKVFVALYALFLVRKSIFKVTGVNDQIINILFLFFSISFWVSYYYSGGSIITILSQYLYKYGLVFVLYYFAKSIMLHDSTRLRLQNTLVLVLYIQVFLSLIKLSFWGFGNEPIVGSMAAGGAGTAVVIPIVGMIFFWVIKNGKFSKIDWLISFSFLIIAIASGKRQPIVFYPLVLVLLFTYVSKSYNLIRILKYLPIGLLLFYFGVRLTPSFTPEDRTMGSFDIEYVRDYALKYYFGTENVTMIFNGKYNTGFGRGSAITYFFNPSMLNLHSTKDILFGKGRYEVAVGEQGRFTKTGFSNYGIDHQGLMGEAGAMIYSFGYIGSLFMLFFAVSVIFTCSNKKLALLIFLYFLWDFLFYYNQVVYSSQSILLVIFIVLYYRTENGIKKNRQLPDDFYDSTKKINYLSGRH